MGWCQLEVVDSKTYRLWITWWHPRFWVESYHELRRQDATVFESVYLTLVFIAQLMKRKR